MDQTFSISNLKHAARKVANYYRFQNYNGSPDAALALLEQEAVLGALREAVMDGGYQFQPLRPYLTPKKDGSVRIETMSSALDRVVVQALLNEPGWVMQQRMNATARIGHLMAAPAYRFNKPHAWFMYNKWQNAFKYFKRTNLKLARRNQHGHVLHLDLQQFYPSVNRERLRGMLQPWFPADAWTLMDRYLDFTIVEHGDVVAAGRSKDRSRPTINGMEQSVRPYGNGLPIEEPSSRLFANLYLQPLDHYVLHELGYCYTRYMDDMYFFLPSREAAKTCREQVTEFLALRLGLFVNMTKAYDEPVKEYLAQADTRLSKELSAVDHQLALLPECPELKPGLEATLDIMLKGMPGPNANPKAEGHQQKIIKASFAAYRVAKLQMKGRENQLALLLQNEKTRYMAAVALCIVDTPQANRHLSTHLKNAPTAMGTFELIRLAGILLSHGKESLLSQLENRAAKDPELLALVRQGFGGMMQIRGGLRHRDELVRKSAALRLMAEPARHRPLVKDLVAAAKREKNRDTLALYLIVAKQFSGNTEARGLLTFMRNHGDKLIRQLADSLLLTMNETKQKKVNQTKGFIPCHP